MFVVRNGRLLGSRQGRARNCEFRQLRASRKALYRPAIQITRGKIRGGEVAAGAQQLVHQADAFEELRPIHIREQSHARDDVAHGDVRCALALMLITHGLVRGCSLRGQAFLQPLQCRRDSRVLIAQTLHELDRKCG